MQRTTLEAIEKLFNSASKDPTRLHLTGINVKKSVETDKIILTATDGHILVSKVVIDDELYSMMKESFIIDPICKPVIKLLLKNKKEMSYFVSSLSDSKMIIESKNYTCKVNFIEREYPRWESTIPKKINDKRIVTLNADLIIRLAKTLELNKRTRGITFTIGDNQTQPIIVNAASGDYDELSVIMPMKL